MCRVFIIGLALVSLLAVEGKAGRRCYRSNYGGGYTLQNSYSWPKHGACYSCHPRAAVKVEAFDWRKAAVVIEKEKIETAAFMEWLRQQQPQGYVQQQSYGGPMGYQTLMNAEFTNTPVAGQTLWGASHFTPPADVQIHATANNLIKLGEQGFMGAQKLGMVAADMSEAADERRERFAAQQLAIQANVAIANGPPPVLEQRTARFSALTMPNGQIVLQPEQQPQYAPQAMQGPDVLQLLTQRCASCHAGANVAGKFNLDAGLDVLTPEQRKDIADRVALPADDPAHMPKAATAEGHGPGPMLDRREINAIEDWAWSGGPY